MTPAQFWAQIVDSRFSVAKHYHVFHSAEACKCFWLQRWGGGRGGWGLGTRVFGGLAHSILVVRGRQLPLTHSGTGGFGRAAADVITPCSKYRCRHLSHPRSPSAASPPSPPSPSLISPSPGSCSVMNSPYSPANDCL